MYLQIQNDIFCNFARNIRVNVLNNWIEFNILTGTLVLLKKEKNKEGLMKKTEMVSNFVGKYMAIIVLVVAALALFVPVSFSWIKTSYITPLLMIVMFGMGLTLKATDFAVVFSRPKDVILGVCAQFILMPIIAFVLVKIFQLPPELAVGVILVGTCPGGTSSNVMTYLAKGDVALSVGMTAVSTLLAPIVTPILTLVFAGQTIDVALFAMFMSIVKVVLIPIALGVIINMTLSKLTEKVVAFLPIISVTAIVAIVASVVAANSARLLSTSAIIFVVVILHNICGYAAGFGIGKIFKMEESRCNTLSIEVGMQNSGLATSLAAIHFASMPLATVAGALFSVWHNISGAILANIMAARMNKLENK